MDGWVGGCVGRCWQVLSRTRFDTIHPLGSDPDRNPPTDQYAKPTTKQRAAEGGYWAAAVRFGLDLYKRGDHTGAVAVLGMAAEEGYELAQANAAYLLEHRMGYR